MTSRPEAERSCRLVAREPSGAFERIALIDPDGVVPGAGQHYLLDGHAAPAAGLLEARDGLRIEFLVRPGAHSEAGEGGKMVRLAGPLGDRFKRPSELVPDAAGAILAGEGIGVAALALLRTELVRQGIPSRTILGFKDEGALGGLGLFDCSEIRVVTADGHRGPRGTTVDLLARLLAGDDAGSAVVYLGGSSAMVETAIAMCAEAGVRWEARSSSACNSTQTPTDG